jgi:hypothetical protein
MELVSYVPLKWHTAIIRSITTWKVIDIHIAMKTYILYKLFVNHFINFKCSLNLGHFEILK